MQQANIDEGFRFSQEQTVAPISPHESVLMLMEDALQYMNTAKNDQINYEFADKEIKISRAISIIYDLIDYLNFDAIGELAYKLANVFNHIVENLRIAVKNYSRQHLDKAAQMFLEIKEGWARIPDDLRETVSTTSLH